MTQEINGCKSKQSSSSSPSSSSSSADEAPVRPLLLLLPAVWERPADSARPSSNWVRRRCPRDLHGQPTAAWSLHPAIRLRSPYSITTTTRTHDLHLRSPAWISICELQLRSPSAISICDLLLLEERPAHTGPLLAASAKQRGPDLSRSAARTSPAEGARRLEDMLGSNGLERRGG